MDPSSGSNTQEYWSEDEQDHKEVNEFIDNDVILNDLIQFRRNNVFYFIDSCVKLLDKKYKELIKN